VLVNNVGASYPSALRFDELETDPSSRERCLVDTLISALRGSGWVGAGWLAL